MPNDVPHSHVADLVDALELLLHPLEGACIASHVADEDDDLYPRRQSSARAAQDTS